MREETKSRIDGFFERQARLEWELHQYWRPHNGQVPIMNLLFRDWVRYLFLQFGRKAGKTETSVVCMIIWAILFPDSQIYYIADTMKHAGELIWENGRLPKFFLKTRRIEGETTEEYEKRREWGRYLHDKYILKERNDENRLFFKNGSFIKLDGSEQYSNADGIEPDFLVYDEFKHHDPRYHEAAEPNLRVKKAPLMIVGTPPDQPNTYYEKIANQFKRLSYARWMKIPSYMNNILYPLGKEDPEFQEEYNKYLPDDEDVAQRELLAEIVVAGSKSLLPTLDIPPMDANAFEDNKVIPGKFSRHWRPYDEVKRKIERNFRDYDFHTVFDPASSSTFGGLFLAFNRHTKKVTALDVIYETKVEEMSTMMIMPRALEIMSEWQNDFSEWTITYDNAAKWFQNEVQYNYNDAPFSLTPCDKDLKNKEAKLGQIKEMLKWDFFEMTDKCWWLLWEMMSYRKDEKGRIPKENDHLIDCLRYGLNAMGYDFNEVIQETKTEEQKMKRVESENVGDNNGFYELNEDINYMEEDYGDNDWY